MSLNAKQIEFTTALADLIKYGNRRGYGIILGEVWRGEAQARWNAENGVGILRSNHRNKLAADLILHVDGQILWDGPQYKVLAEEWKLNGPLYSWGGDFRGRGRRPGRDVYHYSIKHNGVV